MSLPDDAALAEFVLHEARLLDAGRYPEWLELFAADGRYWVPLQGAAQDPAQPHNAYADEDRLLLRLRIERLQDARAWSQQPRSRGQHLLQTPRVELREAARAVVYTPFLYVEARGEEQLLLAGHWQHSLCVEGGALRIALKRVNLVNAGASLPMIQLFP